MTGRQVIEVLISELSICANLIFYNQTRQVNKKMMHDEGVEKIKAIKRKFQLFKINVTINFMQTFMTTFHEKNEIF